MEEKLEVEQPATVPGDSEIEVETAEEIESAEETLQLQEMIQKMQGEFDNKYKRLQADFENFKRRTQSEKENLGTFVKAEIFESLLPVLDNFDRALQVEINEENKAFLEGFQMIQQQLQEVLEKKGLSKIEALGQQFDPNFHNAIMRGPSEEYEDDQISEVFQEGYSVDGKTIRPAMVKVVNN